MKQLKRYVFALIMLAVTGLLILVNRELGLRAVNTTLFSLKEMILILPPIFVLLGLLDVWVPRETMIRFLGEGSGLKGVLIAITLGSAAAGPLYGAFPVAVILMKKGAKFANILLFIGAWSTTKIPMLLFEISSMGLRFAMTRLAVSLTGIFVIAFVVERVLGRQAIDALYTRSAELDS
ncbi:MAG: permease [Clostridiaceae bacterium]|jgi:uncharacterized membrane protein YraQ (UPF0718 family)|nr:permease [Clostridiaceae bacterium]